MFYIIAMIEGECARVYNTNDDTFKDLKLTTIAKLKQSGAEIKNTGPLKEDGTFLIYGGRHNYPIFRIKEGKKKLITPNIPTVIAHTDAGKTVVVDAFGNKTQRYTVSLSATALTNAEYTPDDRLEGYFETLSFSEYLQQYEASLGIMGMFGADSDLDYKITNGAWEYAGEKKASKIVIPEGVTSLVPNSLNGVILTELILPSTLSKLEKGGLAGVFAQVVHVNSGVLRKIDNQAFFNTRIRELRIYGNVTIHPMAFYGSRITRILAQGATFNACLRNKTDPTTLVKVLK